jgi:NADPH-dependent F420 reductase
MRIGILGGTGNMGRGLALRLSIKHEVTIGSRSANKAVEAAAELTKKASSFYGSKMKGSIKGTLNEDAVEGREIIIETLPPSAAVSFLSMLRDKLTSDQIIVSCVVPMKKKEKLFVWSPIIVAVCNESQSAAELIRDAIVPVKVVSAFQTIPAQYLNDIRSVLDLDVLVAGDDNASVEKTMTLVMDIPGLRPLKVGPLENSKWVESLTPLLLNAAILNKLHDPSIKIVPWNPEES